MSDVSFVAFGNEELRDLPVVQPGMEIIGKTCGHRHTLEAGHTILDDGTKITSDVLLFFTCGEEEYMAALRGKLLFGHTLAEE